MPTISEVLAKADERPEWICNPYVARKGITFMHGKTSIGKSPITWEIARTVDLGIPCFGWPTVRSRVLYLEADSAELILRPRLRHLPQPVGEWRLEFLSGQSLNLCDPTHIMFRLFEAWQREFNPELVIWNTLRQFYKGSAIDSDTVTQVYNAMYRAFPNAGHVVSAHDRKTSTDPDAPNTDDEAFSGSAAWRDLATVGLHLIRRGSALSLEHTKSQVSELMEPLRLMLGENGTTLTCSNPSRERIMELWGRVPKGEDRGTWVARELNISRRTLFRLKGHSEQ